MLCLSFAYLADMKVSFKNYGLGTVSDDRFLSFIGYFAHLASLISRFTTGILSDKLGFKNCYMTILVLEMTTAFTMPFISEYKWAYFSYILVIFALDGATLSIFPSLASYVYGADLGVKMFALLYIAIAFGQFMGLTLITVVLPFYGWTALHFSFGLLALTAFGMLLRYKDEHFEKVQGATDAGSNTDIHQTSERPKFNQVLLDSKKVHFENEEVDKYFNEEHRH